MAGRQAKIRNRGFSNANQEPCPLVSLIRYLYIIFWQLSRLKIHLSVTNPRWIYWTRDFCCWLPAPPPGWGSTKQNTLVLSLPGNPSYDEAMWTSTDTTVDKPTKSRLSVFISSGWTAFSTFTESPTYSSRPRPFLNNPAIPNTPEHIFFVCEVGEVYILLQAG